MLTDSSHTELLIEEKQPASRKLIAAICAIAVTAIVIAGYTYLRRRHTQQVKAQAAAEAQAEIDPNLPKGPAKAHILVDEALLKGGQTTIGGTVQNISNEKLSGLSVGLELRRRQDATLEQISAPIEPPELEPQQEGRYMVRVPAADYSSVRLINLRTGNSSLIAYTTGPGQKRPLEKIEPKVVVVPRPRGKSGEFLNSPDNPARVP